jgi:hypothetical protein
LDRAKVEMRVCQSVTAADHIAEGGQLSNYFRPRLQLFFHTRSVDIKQYALAHIRGLIQWHSNGRVATTSLALPYNIAMVGNPDSLHGTNAS